MNTEDKVIQANNLAKMLKRMETFQFIPLSANGFFITLNEQRVLETETFLMASNGCIQLNQAINQTVDDFRTTLRNRISTILNA